MNRLILSSSYQIRQSLMTQCRSISTSLQLVPKNRKVCFVYGYYGKDYYGNQFNFNKPAVENLITNAIYMAGFYRNTNAWSPSRMKLVRSSRTDKGVSSMRMIMSTKLFVSPTAFDEHGHSSYIVDKVNEYLPEDIRVFSCVRITSSFSPREDAIYRLYNYFIPLLPIYKLGYSLDLPRFQSILSHFIGSYNFKNYTRPSALSSKAREAANGFSRNIYKFNVKGLYGDLIQNPYIQIEVAGNAFIYNQIRKMIGAALYASLGIWNEDYIYMSLYNPTEFRYTPVAPAGPLLLISTSYTGNKHIYMNEEEIECPEKDIYLMNSVENNKANHFLHTYLLPHMLENDVNNREFEEFLQNSNIDYYRKMLSSSVLTEEQKTVIRETIPSYIPKEEDFQKATNELVNSYAYSNNCITSRYEFSFKPSLQDMKPNECYLLCRLFPYSLHNCVVHYFNLIPGHRVQYVMNYMAHEILSNHISAPYTNKDLLHYISNTVGLEECIRRGKLLKDHGFIGKPKGSTKLGICLINKEGKQLVDYL